MTHPWEKAIWHSILVGSCSTSRLQLQCAPCGAKNKKLRVTPITFSGSTKNLGRNAELAKNRKNNWVHEVTELASFWIIFNSTALFAVYLLGMDNPRYLYSRVGQFSGLCAVLELLVYWQAYFIMNLSWGFFFVLVPKASLLWMRNIAWVSHFPRSHAWNLALILR